MTRIFELLGLCAPLIGLALAVYYRRRLAAAFTPAVMAAVVAGIGSVIAVVTDRLAWFGDAQQITGRVEAGATARTALLLLAVLILLVPLLRRSTTGAG